MKDYYKKGKGIRGGKLQWLDFAAAFMTPRRDHPGKAGSPTIYKEEVTGTHTAEAAMKKVRISRPPRRRKVLRMIAGRDKSLHILPRHRRQCNVIMAKMRREAITKRRHSKSKSG